MDQLVDTRPAPKPTRVTLPGRLATLVPLDAAAHGAALWDALQDPANDHLWLYMGDGPYRERAAFMTTLEKRMTLEDAVFFTILAGAKPVGYASLMRIDTVNRVIEVGNIMYAPALQRTPAATEAMYLLARYVFDDLGYRRYEWKCNSLNEPSRRAAKRFGFEFEGIFRQHMIIKGRNRDTAWFSMLDSEWRGRKLAFEAWLKPENFDTRGQQLRRLRGE